MRFILHEIVCYHCGHDWTFSPPLSRGADCPSCKRPCKVCLNCRDFDPQAHHECRESQAEWVKYKDAGNFCSYFRPQTKKAAGNPDEANHAALAALFHGKTKTTSDDSNRQLAPPAKPDPNEQLDALFKPKEAAPVPDDSASGASVKNSLEAELAKFLRSK